MQIIIPMAGIGQRFTEANYSVPKPLIEVDGRSIIEYVVELFPGEKNFIFVCNADHLKQTNMAEILKNIAPEAEIIPIKPHKKGPVYTVSKIFDLLNLEDEVIVNYCDFFTYWDYEGFLKHTRERQADGAIAAYKGFHPHMLGDTHYAFIREENQWMLEIKEKEPFTTNRMQEFASNGTYYFRSGKLVKKYFQELMEKNIHTHGEFYTSLVYNLLVRDSLKVSIYQIQHMLQWGTPQDLEEQQNWSNYFKKTLDVHVNLESEKGSITLVPLAGKGERFQEIYSIPKPLIPISGHPMVVQAIRDLPQSEKQVFVCLKAHLDRSSLVEELKKNWPKCEIISLENSTEGQAITCELGLKNENLESPLLISACDNGCVWNQEGYKKLREDLSNDVIVWSFRNHPSSLRNPQMYGWLKTDAEDNILEVSVKKALSGDPKTHHAIVGTFYFRKANLFTKAFHKMIKDNIRVNGEFYVDSCIDILVKMGYKAKVFEVDHYVCWGTPNDLKSFNYWQSYFHKYKSHPYNLEKDPKVNKSFVEKFNHREHRAHREISK